MIEGQVELLLLNREHIKALASVPCSEVYGAVSISMPRAIREIAAEVDRSPASVGEHMDTLLRVGLVIPAGTRRRRSRTETLYVRSSRTNRFEIAEQDWETIEVYLQRFRGQMRLLERQHDAAQQTAHEDPAFIDFLLWKHRNVYLSRESAGRVKHAVSSLFELILSLSEPTPEHPAESDLVQVTIGTLILPSVSSSKRARRSK